MKKVISFCVYGNEEKYIKGLTKNLEIINDKLPDFYSYIYAGADIKEEQLVEYNSFKNVKIVRKNISDSLIKFDRFFPIDDEDVEVCFSRDIDSRINERDIWTMREFIASEKKFHIIRDHHWHKMRIMAGCFGIKKINGLKIKDEFENWKESQTNFNYGSDENFLQEIIYPKISSCCLIHSDIVGYIGEQIERIKSPMKTEYDFIGNVVEMKNGLEKYKFTYNNIPFQEQFDFLYRQEQWGLLIELFKRKDIMEIESIKRYSIIYGLYQANYYTNNINGCIEILKLYRYTHVDDHLIKNSNWLIYRLGKKIIGTTDLTRIPNDNEIIVYYGNFYHSVDCLPISNKLYRHPKYFFHLRHDKIEYDDCWERINQIYILNLEEREDRYLEILIELCKMNAPLDRIYHYKAKKEIITGDKKTDTYYGAGKNHCDVMKRFIEEKYDNCLVLEDDFTFSSRIEEHKRDLKEFFKRNYDFDVCLLAASKYWDIKQYDDLLSLSYQACTTTAGYILNKRTVEKVLTVMEEGNRKYLETRNEMYVCDQYWKIIQKDNKFFLFNLKMGYQRPNYSNITEKTVCQFD
jgi:GR25 family glycosyltransferase involved in LPS biosynthesis